MYERLEPLTPWTGGRVTGIDVLELAEAAAMASIHAGATVTIKDFLRAAGRGEIFLKAIIHNTAKVQSHDGGIYCNAGQENENIAPAGAVLTLPLTACQHLATTGRASWRTFDGFEMRDGVLCRYTKGILVPGEPDFETVPDDCRVMGYAVHALADAYKVIDDNPPQAAQKAAYAIEPAPPPWHLLATPSDLIKVFGTITGMNKTWFNNVKDTPGLKAAKHTAGAGGHKGREPLYRVFDVMLWLINPKRRKGNAMQEATGWRLLKNQFPKVYGEYQGYEP